MGTLLAVLPGVAAGFLLLAMPTRMLETVTTATRLSSLMVQAEPPISPSDKTLLSVLAGVLTAGIGWVLIDWLMFGRAGLSALIRTREDEYEDEDDDLYRPTDPLDLVSPVSAGANEWMPSAGGGDTRRPLSARTDIGDPPAGGGFDPRTAMPGLNRPLPPMDQIVPGAGIAPPPLPGAIPQPALTQIPQPNGFAPPAMPAAPAAPVYEAAPAIDPAAAAMPSWLPAPGARPDAPPIGRDLPPSLSDIAPARQPSWHPEPPTPVPQAVAAAETGSTRPAAPPPLIPIPNLVPPPLIQDVAAAPSADPPRGRETLDVPFITPEPALAPAPPSAPASVEPQEPIPPAAAPAAVMPVQQTSASVPAPAARQTGLGFDAAQIEQLLTKLEETVKRRRAAAAARAAQVEQTAPRPVAVAPVPPVVQPMAPPRAEPPAAYSAPREIVAPPRPEFDLPPLEPLPGVAPSPQPTPVAAPVAPAPIPAPQLEQGGDLLLDQPLHVTLDQLRNMVRR